MLLWNHPTGLADRIDKAITASRGRGVGRFLMGRFGDVVLNGGGVNVGVNPKIGGFYPQNEW